MRYFKNSLLESELLYKILEFSLNKSCLNIVLFLFDRWDSLMVNFEEVVTV